MVIISVTASVIGRTGELVDVVAVLEEEEDTVLVDVVLVLEVVVLGVVDVAVHFHVDGLSVLVGRAVVVDPPVDDVAVVVVDIAVVVDVWVVDVVVVDGVVVDVDGVVAGVVEASTDPVIIPIQSIE